MSHRADYQGIQFLDCPVFTQRRHVMISFIFFPLIVIVCDKDVEHVIPMTVSVLRECQWTTEFNVQGYVKYVGATPVAESPTRKLQ